MLNFWTVLTQEERCIYLFLNLWSFQQRIRKTVTLLIKWGKITEIYGYTCSLSFYFQHPMIYMFWHIIIQWLTILSKFSDDMSVYIWPPELLAICEKLRGIEKALRRWRDTIKKLQYSKFKISTYYSMSNVQIGRKSVLLHLPLLMLWDIFCLKVLIKGTLHVSFR